LTPDHDRILDLLRQGRHADLMACQTAAVEPLRAFLFAREPSGLFQTRCRAVEVLAALGARNVLADFLAHPREVADPVEQAGEDAVMNAVARALMLWPDDHVYGLLLAVSARKLLDGVVEALSPYGRVEAVPVLAAALADDFCRPAAETAFRRMGETACPYLLHLAAGPVPDPEPESSRRRRRSALRLFGELYRGEDWRSVHSLTADADDRVAVTACSLCLPRVSPVLQKQVAARLVALFAGADWLLREEIEDVLVQHYALCREVIEKNLAGASDSVVASLLRKTVTRAGGKESIAETLL